jgi:carboxylesterase
MSPTFVSDQKSNISDLKAEPFNPDPAKLTLPGGLKVGVLLIHGLTGMPNEMKPVAKQLEKIGCEVAVPLLPGHDGGHKALLATGWKDWQAGAREALDKLSQTCDKIVVGGLSMGGLIGMLLSLENPKVCGVVALSPTIEYDGRNSSNPFRVLLPLIDLLPFAGPYFYWTEAPPYGLKDERLQKMITKQVEKAKRGGSTDFGQFRTYAGSLRQLQRLVNEVKKRASEVRIPVLIVHSLEDTLTTHKNALTFYSWLNNCPDKKIIWMEGCDHVLTLDLKKEEVAYHCAEFTCRTVAKAIRTTAVTA